MNVSFPREIAATLQWMSEETGLPMSAILSSALVYTIKNGKEGGADTNEAEIRLFKKADDFLKLQYGPPEPRFVQSALFEEPADDPF